MRLEHLGHDFDSLTALDDVSLEAHRGEVLVLLGANGSGKSTLLALAAGLLTPTRGRVVFEAASSRAERLRRVGYCPQRSLVFPDLTAHEQLTLAGRAYGLARSDASARATDLLASLGLEDKARETPAALSGGMLRRLNLAFALLHRPELLLLDEPSAGLDRAAQRLFHESLREPRARGAAVVLATHDLAEVETLADRVAVLDRGKLVAIDTPRALLARLDRSATVEIELSSPADDALKGALEERLSHYAPRWRGATLTLATDGVTDALTDVVACVVSAGASPRSIVSRSGSLADVYAKLTGRSLRS